MRAAIQNYGRKWVANFTRVADAKPRLARLPMEIGGLIFLLCYLCFEIGVRLGSGSKHPSSLGFESALVVNWIAFQFRWSQRTTVILRTAAFGWLVAIVLFWP